MIFCVLAFIAIYAAVLGVATITLDIQWQIPISDITAPIWGIFMLGGLLASICVLGVIRMMGERSGKEDPDVVYRTTRITAWLGLLATVAICAIQTYFRTAFDINNFLFYKGEWLQDALKLSAPTLDGMLLFLALALPVLIGIPVFIFAFYSQSFDEYVTVHYVEMGGEDVETGHSDAYLPIWPTLLVGLLLSAALVFLALTPLAYLLIVPFAILLFGYPDKKRIITASVISGILAVVAVILSFALSAGSTFGTKETEGLVYSDIGSGYCISGYNGTDTEIVIPKKHEGKPVTAIGEHAFADTAITSVTIPATVKTIEARAFENCTALESVTLPRALTTIGEAAFKNCTALKTVDLPQALITIGKNAFYDCQSLAEVTIPAGVTSIGSEAFSGSPTLIVRAVAASAPEGWATDAIGAIIIWNCRKNDIATDGYIHTYVSGVHYRIKDDRAEVGYRHASDLGAVTIPAFVTYKKNSYPVKSIMWNAFSGSSLTSVTIPTTVEEIDHSAFAGCQSLESVTFLTGSKVLRIGTGAFAECPLLTSLTIPASVESIESDLVANSPLVTVYCEAESKPDGWYTNWNSSNAPVVWNCKKNEVADDGCIYTMINGLRYTLKDGEATVVKQASTLKAVEIPTSVTYKKKTYAVTAIDYYAFESCCDLVTVTIPASILRIESSAFRYTRSLTIYCEAASRPEGWSISWKESDVPVVWRCKENEVADDGYIYTMINGLRYALKNGKATVAKQPSDITAADIPTEVSYKGSSYPVTMIDGSAFSGCQALSRVTIPSSIKTIGSHAFYRCTALSEVVIPASVTVVGEELFNDSGIKTVYCEAQSIPDGWHKDWTEWYRGDVVWGYNGNN